MSSEPAHVELDFPRRVEARTLGAINRKVIASEPQHLGHTPHEVSGHYFVNLQLAGFRAAVKRGGFTAARGLQTSHPDILAVSVSLT